MRKQDFVVRFAGEGGEGVVTAAEMLARAATTAGYHVQTFVTFPSQIKGGPTWSQVRISTQPVLSPGDDLDVLVALNHEAYEEHRGEVRQGGLIIHDSSFSPPSSMHAIPVPIGQMAKEAGEARSANMVLLGVVSSLVSMPKAYLESFIAERFKGREATIQANITALNLGYGHASATGMRIGELARPEKPKYQQLLLKGNDALSLGAIAAGLEFFVGYPISPATPILLFMQRNLVGPGKFAYQVSSEIEAINTIIGAGFAGRKAMTATSGPGLSLMSEGIGLAWMTEIPVVIVDVQRGGPATGLPTKSEQSDLLAALTPAHGDSSPPIIAPGTVEECFYAAINAINWAERYQGPVILLSEHSLAERTQNIPAPDLSEVVVENRRTFEGNGGYLRYESATVSPMPVPGMPGSYVANGSEHDPWGDTTHRPDRHIHMTERRFNKLKLLEDGAYESLGSEHPVALLPWGSTKGPALEAYRVLASEGIPLAWYFTTQLHPLPPALLEELRRKELVIVPELNFQGQFSRVLRSMGVRAESITQYNGLPFKIRDLAENISHVAASLTGKRVTV